MKTITLSELSDFCSGASISIPKSDVGIGNDLSFFDCPARTVVIHFSETDVPDYLQKILNIIFSVDRAWLLVPRFQFQPDWNIPNTTENDAAILFESNAITELSTLLVKRLQYIKSFTEDLFIISGSGNLLMRFDHHFLDEGLDLYVKDIKKSNQLLVALNDIGSELEVYYNNGG
jgi:hypothetical protein